MYYILFLLFFKIQHPLFWGFGEDYIRLFLTELLFNFEDEGTSRKLFPYHIGYGSDPNKAIHINNIYYGFVRSSKEALCTFFSFSHGIASSILPFINLQ